MTGRGTVAELTSALTSGLFPRRFVPNPSRPASYECPPAVDVASPLLPYSGLLGHAANARPSPIRPVIRLARKLAKGLIRPWLELQTFFNHRAIAVLDAIQLQTHSSLSQLHQRCQELELALDQSVRANHALALRLSECYDEVLRDRSAVRSISDELESLRDRLDKVSTAPAEESIAAPGLSKQAIAEVFLFTRLLPPPARVLVLGSHDRLASIDLTAVGYQVAADSPGQAPTAESGLDVIVILEPVALDATIAELNRWLVTGGRFIVAVELPCLGKSSDRANSLILDSLVGSGRDRWQVIEQSYAVRSTRGWTFTANKPADTDEGLVLIVVEKI